MTPLNDTLRALGNDDIVLKEEQYEALLAVAVHRKDCLVVLPTGFGKSFDHCVVVAPLNALMRDQVSKLLDKIAVAILKK